MIKVMKTKEELEEMRSSLIDLALFLLTKDPDRVIWTGYGRKCTIFNNLPFRFKKVYPFKVTVFGHLYLDGIYRTSDVVVSVLTKVKCIDLTLKEINTNL